MATLGHGTTITFGTTGFAANLLAIGGVSLERGAVDTTHMGTTVAKTFTPEELYDGGSVDITFEFSGADDPPIDQPPETVTLDWGGVGVGEKWSFSAFLTSYSPEAPIDDRMTASATMKVTGAVTTGA